MDTTVNPDVYAYVGGNPVSMIDPLGLYQSWVHRRFTLEGAAAAGMTTTMAKELADAVVRADDGTQADGVPLAVEG